MRVHNPIPSGSSPRVRFCATPVGSPPNSIIRILTRSVSQLWIWIKERQVSRCGTKRLQVSESVSLGDKRFVAVIEVDGLQFLIGGGPSNISMLAQLNSTEKFGEVLSETINAAGNRCIPQSRGQA
jgi:Flagellar biosynthesis protein, FliO